MVHVDVPKGLASESVTGLRELVSLVSEKDDRLDEDILGRVVLLP